MPGTLMIVAKEPIAGHCKTRLCPPLAYAQAAELYSGFLADLLQRLHDMSHDGLATGVAYTPNDAVHYFRAKSPAGLRLLPQAGGDLGQRLAAVARACLAQESGPVVILSSDSPNLPGEYLRQAFAALAGADVVLGPAEDGGYYLVGLRAYTPQIFADIAWSTEAVLQQTLARAAAAGLSVALLPPWYDVDTVADLRRLASDVLRPEARALNPATAAVLSRMGEALA